LEIKTSMFERAPTWTRRKLNVRWSSIAVAVIIAATFTGANAQTPTPSRQTEELKSGSITGRVVNESGQPLAGATVYARLAGYTLGTRTVTSNVEGNFQINGLDPAVYYLSANSASYVAPPFDMDTPQPVYRIGDSVRLELIKGGVITGTVTNSLNEPIVGTRVRATMIKDASGKSNKGVSFSVGERSTDDRGIYRIYGLAPGTYIVQAGGMGTFSNASPGNLDAPTFAPSSTRDTASEIQVRSGEETAVDIRYRGEQGHLISGTVKTSSTGGTSILLTSVGDGYMPVNNSYQAPGSKGFTLSGVADGEYEIIAQDVILQPSMPYPDLAFSDPMHVSVKGADVTGLELIPKPLGSIGGKILLEPSKLPECQNKRQPLFNETLVTLVQSKKERDADPSAIFRVFGGTSTVDRDGTFSVKNLRAGQYSLNPRFFARYWYLKSMTLGAAPAGPATKTTISTNKDAARNWTMLKGGERVSGLTITLSEGAASIRGKVETGEDARPAPGSLVYLVPAERDKLDDPLHFFVSDIGGDLSFSLSNLPPGRYLSLVQAPVENTPTTTDKLRLPDALDARTRIRRAAEAIKVEIEMKPCQNLTDYSLKLKP
jgi:hypothetical protein